MADQNDGRQQPGEQNAQTAQISGTVQLQPQGGAQQGPGDKRNNGEPKEDEYPEKKSRKRVVILAVVALIVIIAGLFYWHSTYTEDTDDAQVDGNLYQVSSRVAGQVIQVNVEEQQLVHKGDPIAEIDSRDFDVALQQAEANLASARADYEQARVNVPITSVTTRTQVLTSGSDVQSALAGVEAANAQAQAAQSRIAQAQANAQKAQLDVDRYTPLVAKDVISKQQFDQAVAVSIADQAGLTEAQRSAAAAQQQIRAAQAKLAQARSQASQSIQTAPNQVAAQRAREQAALAAVQQAQARVDQAKLNVGYTKIVAPITGIISRKTVSVGANLSVGQALLTIVPLEDLWVTANFKETQLREMQVGQPVEISVDAIGGRKFDGYVKQIGGATGSSLSLFPPENATGNYVKVVQRIPVRINFKNLSEQDKDHELRIGMSVVPKVRVKS
ncbi:MAG TPA: HlyD family secretion protein [Acidobacteriaceae bacterium]|nr:HlyD family secretion protein [Acidobacteriaceae bacterium]